jgi:hypothetical protein
VKDLRIKVAFAVSQDVAVVAPFKLPTHVQAVQTVLAPHIANAVVATSLIVDEPKLSREQFLDALHAEREYVDRYAKEHDAWFVKVDTARREFSKNVDKQVFAYADNDSVVKLIAYCGWEHHWAGGRSGGWFAYGKFGKYLGWSLSRLWRFFFGAPSFANIIGRRRHLAGPASFSSPAVSLGSWELI